MRQGRPMLRWEDYVKRDARKAGEEEDNTIQYNTIKFISTFIHVNNYYNTLHFLNEKSKRICRKLNKLIRDIPRITHNQFT